MDDMLVLVVGASGRSGREVVDVLLDHGVRVRGQSTTEEGADSLAIQGVHDPVVGDLFDPADCARMVEGVDAVVCTVGSSPGLRDLVGADPVDGRGVMNLVDACEAADVERFVIETAIGVNEARPGMPGPFRAALNAFGIIAAKERGENYVRNSDLDWTVIRPGGLTDDPATGDVLVGEGGDTVSGTVPRADVARLLVAALFTPESVGRTFEVVSREGARGTSQGVVGVDWRLPGEVTSTG